MSGLRKITKNNDLSKIKMIVRACWVEVVIADELVMPEKRLNRNGNPPRGCRVDRVF